MKNLIDSIINRRYIIAILLFIVAVSLNLNGSSSNAWSLFGVSDSGRNGSVVSQTEETIDNWISLPPDKDGTIWGLPRVIRSDEWMVQSSFFISQTDQEEEVENSGYGLSTQNMIVAYNSPVRHISIIGKPFNWGGLFLSPSRALSWYWSFKIITFILLSFEFCLILTSKNKLLSLIGAFWITYTPAIQWWFMQHLGDVVWYSLLAMVAIYHFFHQDARWKKLIFAGLLSSSLIGFVLVIYPAFQVVFAYLILGYFLYYFVGSLRNQRIDRFDWLVMSATAVVTFIIVAYSLWESKEAILATLNTVYPGSRVSTGGEYKFSDWIILLLNPVLPFKLPTVSNQVELASSLNFLPFMIFSLPIVIKKDKLSSNIIGLFFFAYSLLLYLYSVIGIPEWLSKLTLFSFVTGGRSWQAMAVIAVFASIWFVSYIWREKHNNTNIQIFSALLVTVLIWGMFVVNDSDYYNYVSRSQMLMILGLLTLGYILAVLRLKKSFAIMAMFAIFISGFTINPIVKGVSVIEERQLAKQIEVLTDKDQEALWLVDNSMLYNYPQMLGAKTLNGVRFYPDERLMSILDPKSEEEEDWNRYAHTRITLTDQKTSLSTQVSPDVLNVSLNVEQLSQLKVSYVLTNRDLSQLFPNKFRRLYGPDLDNNMIFYYED